MRNFSSDVLKGKTAIITGGGGLLGPHHAIGLSFAGAKVVLADINKEGLEESKNKILQVNKEAQIDTIILDITNLQAVEEFEKSYRENNKYIDILINNAALNPKMKEFGSKVTGRIEDYDLNEWKKEIDVGITGAFICSRVFGSVMAQNRDGVIINISSDWLLEHLIKEFILQP